MKIRSLGAALMSAAALAAAAGCASGTETPDAQRPAGQHHAEQQPPQQADFNHNDVMFAQNMVPHHEQAVRMANQVPSRTQNLELLDLANRIGAAQQPEIDKMNGWLRDWHAEAGHQEHSMGGMMSPADMAGLERSKGDDFDQQWLRMMIEHHRGAVRMSQTELSGGQNPDAKALANQIIDSQRSQIDEMNGLLARS